ncbi:MAG: response regulator [Lachnospiraceae bacterium]|nr:response regulator [Lachnospiraceae bacterium]
MASYTVTIIREKMTFMVNSIVINLRKANYNVNEANMDVSNISTYVDESDILILYSDEEIGGKQNTLVYLRDLCVEKSKLMILIGVKEEIDEVTAYIPPHLFADIIKRPLDMNAFIERVDEIMNDEEIESRKKSILLVDDDPGYIHLLYEWLKDEYRVGMANSGMQAITWLARNNVDLILLDYEMPILSGLQVLELFKSEQYAKDIPVMFLTGKSDRESIMKVMELKPAGYMLKDINKFQLLANLNKFFVKQTYSKM